MPVTRTDDSGAKGTRTPNPLLAKQVRYQLRHGPRSRCTISMDGTAESLLRNGTYQMARDIRHETINNGFNDTAWLPLGDGA